MNTNSLSRFSPKKFLFAFGCFAAASLPTQTSEAATVANDDASNQAYLNGWQNGSNGGNGLGAWRLTSSSPSNFSITQHWTLETQNSNAQATRLFGSPLEIGETFSIDFITPLLTSGASSGVRLENSLGEVIFELQYKGGNGTYTIYDGHGSPGKSIGISDKGLNIEFTLTSASTYQLSLTSLGSTGSFNNKNGTIIGPSGGLEISQFSVFFDNSTSTKATQSFNNVSVIPEPDGIALILGASLVILAYKFPRWRTTR